MGSAWLQVVLLAAATFTCVLAIQGDYSDLPPGPYCGARPDGCCPGRIDACSAPIYGTMCYCDDFCNRTRNEDCCPDFWSFCKGVAPPMEIRQGCYYGGTYYNYRESAKINCNTCTCKESVQQPGTMELACEQTPCMVESDLLAGVNANQRLGWRASNYSFFWGRTLQDGVQYRLGTLEPRKTIRGMIPVKRQYDVRRLPRSFDARTKWPGWVSGVQDQGWCGSSWALSTVQVASDRLALMSQGAEQVELSAQQLLECNSRGQQACHGGHLDRAWLYIRKYGLVEERCYSYTSGSSGSTGKCKIPKRMRSLRAARCIPQAQLSPPRTELYRTGPAYRLGSEQDIMHEIMESGPVQATMSVHRDFFMYRGGVYHPSPATNSRSEGYHSVRLLGWGEEAGADGRPVKFWLAANSWGTLWGENGHFRIRRGSNDCEVESYVLAAWAHSADRGVSSNSFPPPAPPRFASNQI